MMNLLRGTCFFLLLPCLAIAASPTPLYQIDVLVFTHLTNHLATADKTNAPVLSPDRGDAMLLPNTPLAAITPYHRLPTSMSQLRDAYWTLNHKPQYQILFHYSWLQPQNSQKTMALLPENTGGWNVEGTLNIRQGTYYQLDTKLFFSAPNSGQPAFIFAQKQRLKPNVTYYIDHPQAGMLIKVHPVA